MANDASMLVGKTITLIELASDHKAIRFTADGDQIIARCDGDCCSETWIEAIEMPAGGLPAKVMAATDLDVRESGEVNNELIQFYGLKLTTDKGDFVLDYRNSSNGYYGGNLTWPEEYHYGGVYGQNNSTEKWVQCHG